MTKRVIVVGAGGQDGKILTSKFEKSDNFIVASGEAHTVREFIEAVFSFFNINYKKYVVEDKSLLFRTPFIKIGDISKIKSTLNWQPKRSFKDFTKDLIIDYKNIN